ncbi:NAD(P)/FAD-dependent oxidoreductase [Psychrobacter sp. TAE2020]|uniref:NAD(P)/FAD-dependent oxidoreductase n=1 Tax=Psychrobacter sp. TAE2020 TaxID=2846762 RepID=UPI001E307123|nr:FAD-binding oxidoreductase [Psychrobacter sp. TAE2020]
MSNNTLPNDALTNNTLPNNNHRNIPHYSDNGQYPDSYYAASRNPKPDRPTLKNDIQAEICVVGGGYSGLSAGLHLIETGHEVVVLEGAQIGWGASGRNGGQIVNGLNASLEKIKKSYGQKNADFVSQLVTRGGKIIRRFISDYDIKCDLKEKNIFAAFNTSQLKDLQSTHDLWESYGMHDREMLDKEGIEKYINTDAYVGGIIDHSGGHFHPLNLALGEAVAIEQGGGTIYENTLVVDIEYADDSIKVITEFGTVTCKQAVLCGNAYLNKVIPKLTDRVMPVSTQIIATEPLGDLANELIPSDVCVEDVRYILDYYRLSADKRMLFGGGSVYGGQDPADIANKIKPNMYKIFPQLRDFKVDYAWSGNFALSFSRVPQLGKLHDRVYFAHGYSGHGVTGSHLFGQILADAINGKTAEFDAFAQIPWIPFPGGRALRVPYSVMGSWWYALKDSTGM